MERGLTSVVESNRLLYLQPQRGLNCGCGAASPTTCPRHGGRRPGRTCGRAGLDSHMTLQELGFSSSKMRYESCIGGGDTCIPGGL